MEHNEKWIKISMIIALFCIAGAIFYFAITNKQVKEKELQYQQEQKEEKCLNYKWGTYGKSEC